MKAPLVRAATARDAEQAIEVVRRSIELLCQADHGNDPATLARWLANKTPQAFESWLEDPDNFCVVAEIAACVRGVGLLHRSGEVRLFYIAPGHQGRGLGTRIHAALEEQAAKWHLIRLHLESTVLAIPFYQAVGYRCSGRKKHLFGQLHAYSCEKMLAA